MVEEVAWRIRVAEEKLWLVAEEENNQETEAVDFYRTWKGSHQAAY